MKTIKLLAITAALGCAIGTAQAQTAGTIESGPYMPANAGALTENSTVRNPGDIAAAETERARDEAIARQRADRKGTVKVMRAGPASAEDIKVGLEVRDSKGAVVGKIEEVTLSVAVLHADGGKVEVPLEAFGKNSKGLLIGMTKAEFDALVAQANKPAG
jgi:hypothetical protein